MYQRGDVPVSVVNRTVVPEGFAGSVMVTSTTPLKDPAFGEIVGAVRVGREFTVTVTGSARALTSPRLSVALAVTEYVPAGTRVQAKAGTAKLVTAVSPSFWRGMPLGGGPEKYSTLMRLALNKETFGAM